jgi:16S rRNA (cytosine967-C5)-methyltransferase
VRRWRRHGDRLISILEGSNRTPDVVLRVNHAATTRERVLKVLGASRVSCSASLLSDACIRVHGRLDLPEFPPFRRGEVSVQDESEALVAELVDPLPGERILDLCAAPGGKTCHLLERSQGMTRVVAMDPVRSRLVRAGENMLRIRLRAALVVADGREPPFAERFDTVLVDAPCTGTGVLARRADARWRLESEDPARCARLQAELLERAAALVGVGGLLVYSVCSIEPEETTDLLERFLETHPGFREETVRALPQRARDPHGRLLILPGLEGCDGVFGVRLRRSA